MAGFEKQSSFCIQITLVFFAEQPSTDHALQWLSTSDYEKHSTYLRCTRAQNNYTQENNNTIRNKESIREWDKSLWSNETCMAWQKGPPHAGWGFLEAEYQLCPTGEVHQLLGACILLNRDSYRNCKIGLPHCQMQNQLGIVEYTMLVPLKFQHLSHYNVIKRFGFWTCGTTWKLHLPEERSNFSFSRFQRKTWPVQTK